MNNYLPEKPNLYQISKMVIEDDELSLAALGLFSFLSSLPWDEYYDITDFRDDVRKYAIELLNKKYIRSNDDNENQYQINYEKINEK